MRTRLLNRRAASFSLLPLRQFSGSNAQILFSLRHPHKTLFPQSNLEPIEQNIEPLESNNKRESYKLPDDFQLVSEQPDPAKVEEVAERNKKATQIMLEKHPEVMVESFSGEIAYTVRKVSPQEMIKAGGLISSSKIWRSNVNYYHSDFGNNSGSICFSLLPEVTGLFINNIVQGIVPHIYAFPLFGKFPVPGGKWREVDSVGSFPYRKGLEWASRSVLHVGDEYVHLGPPVGFFAGSQTSIPKDQIKPFLNFLTCKTLKLPKLNIHQSEDYPAYPEIIDTPRSAEFQRKIENYYKSKICQQILEHKEEAPAFRHPSSFRI